MTIRSIINSNTDNNYILLPDNSENFITIDASNNYIGLNVTDPQKTIDISNESISINNGSLILNNTNIFTDNSQNITYNDSLSKISHIKVKNGLIIDYKTI